MWRALVFIGLLALAAFGAVWLADRPGDVAITWGGYRIQTTVAVAAVMTIAAAMALAVLWAVVTGLIRLPARLTFASRARKRARGFEAVSRGMVAVGAGDQLAAKRYAGEAERLLGPEPLTLLLRAQSAQLTGDRSTADRAFRRMLDMKETRVLGLRGLFVEARRRGDAQEAAAHAAEAAKLSPSASWANEALLEAQSAAGDWRGAIALLERRASLGLIDKETARRHRAVLLAASAIKDVETNPDRALADAQEAARLNPGLVPAAALAGRLLSRRGELRKAARVLEAAWKASPHPDIADTYLDLRPGDSALDRLSRAETLAKLSSWSPEARLALSRAALEAREFTRARAVLGPLLEERPTVSAYFLLADIEAAEHGDSGEVRGALARAARAPRDPAWMADGVVFDHWEPVSPISGRLDAFVWEAPPDVLPPPSMAQVDDVVADVDPDPRPVLEIAPAPAPAPVAVAEPEPEPAPEPQPESALSRMGRVAEPVPAEPGRAHANGDAREVVVETGARAGRGPATEEVVVPSTRLPDDPGPLASEEPRSRLRRHG